MAQTADDNERFFGPYSYTLGLSQHAVDNDRGIISVNDLNNGLVFELTSNCLTYVDAVCVLGRLLDDDDLIHDKKRFSTALYHVRDVYTRAKPMNRKSYYKPDARQKYYEQPFPYPTLKSSSNSTADSSSTTSRRDSFVSHGSSSLGASLENDCWDPNADEQGSDTYMLHQQQETEEEQQLAKIQQEADWIAPDHLVAAASLQPHITCNICHGYLYNAVTITDCLHTFCKTCILKHIHVSLRCPTCNLLIHPTDPVTNMKHDIVLQDIVYRILPNLQKDEIEKEKLYYEENSLPNPKDLAKDKQVVYENMMTVVLEFAGCSDSRIKYEPLQKKYLRVPDITTIGVLQSFVRRKLRLADKHDAIFFCDYNLLHTDLNVGMLHELLFTDQMDEPDLVIIQYGLMFRKDYWSKQSAIQQQQQQQCA